MYGSSPPAAAAPKDLNRPFPPVSAAQHHHQMGSSGLLRYRSAPSSILGELCEDFLPVRPSSPETETMFARFLSPDLRDEIRSDKHPPRPSASGGGGSQRNPQFPPQPPPPAAAAAAAAIEDLEEENHIGYSSAAAAAAASQMMFQQNQIQNQMATSTSMVMETDHHRHHHHLQLKRSSCNSSSNNNNLLRHSSSPAGLFTHLNVDMNAAGYGVMSGIGGFSNDNDNSRLKRQLSFSSRQSSSAGLMSQISEIENDESIGGYPMQPSWEDSPLLSSENNNNNNFSSPGLKRPSDNHRTETRSGEGRNGLSHQFSLPKTSSEMAAIEKFLQFQDSVPCKIRAKRGCATHPRSIAERVRRTRISERMRKLQELVPNMDKQTNTADMLDLAVDYIKDLQKQVKTLSDNRASCTCSSSSKQKPYSNPIV